MPSPIRFLRSVERAPKVARRRRWALASAPRNSVDAIGAAAVAASLKVAYCAPIGTVAALICTAAAVLSSMVAGPPPANGLKATARGADGGGCEGRSVRGTVAAAGTASTAAWPANMARVAAPARPSASRRELDLLSSFKGKSLPAPPRVTFVERYSPPIEGHKLRGTPRRGGRSRGFRPRSSLPLGVEFGFGLWLPIRVPRLATSARDALASVIDAVSRLRGFPHAE